jgi:hypothetical protein
MSIKLFTPYLKPLSKSSTVVVFPSANNQLTTLLGSVNQDFRFSKYALLKIPDILVPTNGANKVQFDTIEGAYSAGLSTSPGSEGDNIDLMQSLQNYALNMETIILSDIGYDNSTKDTVSERVLFKWLKEIGAVRYKAASTEVASTVTDNRYVETDDATSGVLYEKVVKFVGEIDVQGNMDSSLGSRKQVYFYIPSQTGSTPNVIFKVKEDNNYRRNKVIRQAETTDIEYIQGSDSGDNPSPTGLLVKAFYDVDVPVNSFLYTVNGVSKQSWFDGIYTSSYVNSYFTDANPEDLTIDIITRRKLDGTGEVIYRRPRLDAVQLDFNTNNYKAFESDSTMKSFMDYNTAAESDSFDFNAMLIYYDVIVAGAVVATNLYGIMFFGEPSPISGAGTTLKGFYKQKPEKLINQSGNGYGFILNFFIDGNNNVDFAQSSVSVNDYNTYSMQLFSGAMLQMGNIMDKCEIILSKTITSINRISELEQLILNDDNKQSISAELSALKLQMEGSVINNDLGDLLAKHNDLIYQMIAGRTAVDVNLIWNIIAGDGLRYTYDKNNSVLYLNDDKQKYQHTIITNINVAATNQLLDDINRVKVGEKSGLIVHRNNGIDKQANQHIYLRLDKSAGWKTSQTIEVMFDDIIDFNNYSLYVQVGVSGSFTTIGVIPNPYGRFSFQVICIDETANDYIIKM